MYLGIIVNQSKISKNEPYKSQVFQSEHKHLFENVKPYNPGGVTLTKVI